jgi:hypothetical protein
MSPYEVTNMTEAQKVALDFEANIRESLRIYGPPMNTPSVAFRRWDGKKSVEVIYGLVSQARSAEEYVSKSLEEGTIDGNLGAVYMAEILKGYKLLAEMVDNRLLNSAKD